LFVHNALINKSPRPNPKRTPHMLPRSTAVIAAARRISWDMWIVAGYPFRPDLVCTSVPVINGAVARSAADRMAVFA
jgi:hypothetical protein